MSWRVLCAQAGRGWEAVPEPEAKGLLAPRHSGRVVGSGPSPPTLPARPKPANPAGGPPLSGLADLPPTPARWEGLGRLGPLCGSAQ